MSDLIETVAVVAEEVAGGFVRINKADFKEGVHKLFEGLTEAAEGLAEAAASVFTAEAGGTPVSEAGAGQPGDGGAPVAAEAGAGGWGEHPATQPAPPPVEPVSAAPEAAAEPAKAKGK